jgi:hypothetical protein
MPERVATYVARISERTQDRLEQFPSLVRLKRAVWKTIRNRLPNTKIIDGLPLFVPHSAGSTKNLAMLTLDAADRSFPLLVEFVSIDGRRIEDPVPVLSFLDTDSKKAAADRLMTLFSQFGSDKSTLHDYHFVYGSIIVDPDSVTDVLEIGLGSNNPDLVSNMGNQKQTRPGGSLRAFREFLPQARICGADVDEAILFEEERIRTFFVDQTEPDSFDRLSHLIPEEFDLIIDDGLHSPHANIATLLFGLKHLKVGGWHVVEDIAHPALPLWQLISAMMPEHYESHIVETKAAYVFLVRRSQ